MFSGVMVNAWVAGSVVAVVAGTVGFFTVVRGSAFVAHAVPNGSFAGAAAASLAGVNALLGLGVFSLLSALGIGWLSRRGRPDVATALVLTFMLGLGALFLSFGSEYEPQVYSLLFGDVLGVSSRELVPTLALGAVCVLVVTLVLRPLLVTSMLPEVARAHGVSVATMEIVFLIVVALATTMTVPLVGTLLLFSLMIGAPAAARAVTNRPLPAIALSVALAVATIWIAIAAAYATGFPVGFFVGATSALSYAFGRLWRAPRRGARPSRW